MNLALFVSFMEAGFHSNLNQHYNKNKSHLNYTFKQNVVIRYSVKYGDSKNKTLKLKRFYSRAHYKNFCLTKKKFHMSVDRLLFNYAE